MAGEFVTIHGIDAVGKTTTAKNVAELLRLEGADMLDWRSFARESGLEGLVSNHDDFEASIAKKALESDALYCAVEQGRSVVKDRWVLDVMASHAYKGTLVSVDPATMSRLLQPDFSVILTCAEEERMVRVFARGNPTEDDLVPRTLGTRAHFFQEYLLDNVGHYSRRSAVVDTTNRYPYEIAQEVVDRLVDGRGI